MIANHYNECNEIFWNEESFNYSLEEKHIWDMDKYWKLEYFLIKLYESLVDAETLNRGHLRIRTILYAKEFCRVFFRYKSA